MSTLVEMGPVVGVMALCAALGVARATYYRRVAATVGVVVIAAAADAGPVEGPGVSVVERCLPEPGSGPREPAPSLLEAPATLQTAGSAPTAGVPAASTSDLHMTSVGTLDAAVVPKPPKVVPRALSIQQRDDVLALLNGPRFVDLSPGETYATLLDEGTYLCSERTMYRILAEHAEVRERRNLRRHLIYAAPELVATRTNQVWSWDITKLRGPEKGDYFHLYMMLDLYSRYVVGWMVSTSETAAQAEAFIDEACALHNIPRGQLTIHADRGTSMKSKPVALLLADLGVIKSHSRPSVSDDNPYSEAQFKTLKYRPDFPDRFGSLEDARAHCARFCTWYNTQHHHSGIAQLTPHDVFHGHADERIQQRAAVLDAAYAAHPERFVSAPPRPPQLPTAVWINKPNDVPTTEETSSAEATPQKRSIDDDSAGNNAGPVIALSGSTTTKAIVESGSEIRVSNVNDDTIVRTTNMEALTHPSDGQRA